MDKVEDVDSSKAPYVVLIGNVGVGKSTIVEKLTGEEGLSSDSSKSKTKTSNYLWVRDKSLLIADTPGCNPLEEKLEHNIEIASALNFKPVSKIFIVVKADIRIDQTIGFVRTHVHLFNDLLPLDAFSVLVTHMDNVELPEKKFLKALEKDLGFKHCVYSALPKEKDSPKTDFLLSQILPLCGEKHHFTIDGDSFLRLFRVSDEKLTIMKVIKNYVQNFNDYKTAFDEQRKNFSSELMDLYCEFKVFMMEQIEEAKIKMTAKLSFTYMGKKGIIEAGYLAIMVNQLRATMFDIRMEALASCNNHGVDDLRKCPHCGLVWAKFEGCNGQTTCGSRPTVEYDRRNPDITEFATFTFDISSGELQISKNGTKSAAPVASRSEKHIGCGKPINWNNMLSVPVPAEFSTQPKIDLCDITTNPSDKDFTSVFKHIEKELNKADKKAKKRFFKLKR